jgi:hypothetical protein
MYPYPKICEKCSHTWLEQYQFTACPHEWKSVVDENHDQYIKALFHKLWSRDVGTPGYDKKDWMELQRLLQARGVDL